MAECDICFEPGYDVTCPDPCGKSFHLFCARVYLSKSRHNRCPYCQKERSWTLAIRDEDIRIALGEAALDEDAELISRVSIGIIEFNVYDLH